MTDKEILQEVHKILVEKGKSATIHPMAEKHLWEIESFIEQEWQKRDEKEAKVAADEMMEAADEIFGDTTFSKSWYKKRGLAIDEDGTVS